MSRSLTWFAIAAIVLASSAGDLLLSSAMKKVGDLGDYRRRHGILGVVTRVSSTGRFLAAVGCMAVGFFSLLTALSWADVSLVAPASASLSYVTSALGAKYILREHVDRRRWIAAFLVCSGVALLAIP